MFLLSLPEAAPCPGLAEFVTMCRSQRLHLLHLLFQSWQLDADKGSAGSAFLQHQQDVSA